ncbi:hypothetical protein F050043D4_47270 [Bacteroides thetaiotaomicron]|jgi:lipoprotein|uniref:fimbrillin family protein n=1 Tax=Bacteroides thetaiotaomicron TaxID=818 RepID=UPI00101D6866|nr:fimbrillin family protein [Parabacteroides goldsteinii]
MKTRNLFAAALIAAVAFTSCSNDEEVVDNSRKEVKIVASVGALTDNRTRATFQSDGSGEFEVGDVYHLQTYSPTLGGGLSGLDYEIGSTTLYWDEISSDGNPIDFNAWYPVYSFAGNFIQSYKVAGAASEEARDLLMTPRVTVAKYDQVDLQFKHVMHKLTVVLSSNYYPADQLDAATISLQNLKSDAMVDFDNGIVDETAASGTDPYPGPFVTADRKYEFIVAPQTLTAGTEIIEIAMAGGKIYSYKVPTNLSVLESGKELRLKLILNRYGVELQTGSISAWGDQGEIVDEIEFN